MATHRVETSGPRLRPGVAVRLLRWLTPRPPCEECGRGMWRWRPWLIVNDGHYQVMIRLFKWRWFNVHASLDKLSGYRKIYRVWWLRGPIEFREFTAATAAASLKARPKRPSV